MPSTYAHRPGRNVRLLSGLCCKTHLGLPVGSSVVFLSILYPASHQGSCGIDAYISRLTLRLRRASGCERRWAAAEELDEPSQVLRGRGE